MSLLTDFIKRQIQDKLKQRWVIQSDDLFILFKMMGLMDDSEKMMDILEYLEDNKIDVQFPEQLNHEEYGVFISLEKTLKLRKVFKSKGLDIKGQIEKVMSIKPDVDDTFLLEYMVDDEEEIKKIRSSEDKNLTKIQNKIKEEIRNKIIDNLPKIDKTEIENLRNNP